MANASDFLEVEIRKHLLRTGSWTKPTALWIALYTVTPSDSGGGTEVTGGSYVRVNVPPLDANWTAASATDGASDNAVAITFAVPSANWGTVVAFAAHSASTAGDMYFWGPISPSKTINNGDPAPSFAIGALDVTIA